MIGVPLRDDFEGIAGSPGGWKIAPFGGSVLFERDGDGAAFNPGGGSYAWAYHNGGSYSTEHGLEVAVHMLVKSAPGTDIWINALTLPDRDGYQASLTQGGGSCTAWLFRLDNGSYQQLASVGGLPVAEDGDALILRIDEDLDVPVKVVRLRGGVETVLAQAVDDTYRGEGFYGFMALGGIDSVGRAGAFYAGELGGPPPPPPPPPPSPLSIFGELVGPEQVEAATLAHLQKWLPTYLSEVERQRGLTVGSIERPRSWDVTSELDPWPENQLPAVFVISPGIVGEPVKHANKGYTADFQVGIAVVVSVGATASRSAARNLANRYILAIRACILQNRSLGGFASHVSWEDELTTDVPSRKSRTLAAGQVVFTVSVDGVTDPFNGPAQPDPEADPQEPYSRWPTVTATQFILEKEQA